MCKIHQIIYRDLNNSFKITLILLILVILSSCSADKEVNFIDSETIQNENYNELIKIDSKPANYTKLLEIQVNQLIEDNWNLKSLNLILIWCLIMIIVSGILFIYLDIHKKK